MVKQLQIFVGLLEYQQLTCSNCFVDWVHIYAEGTCVSNCWICTTLPAALQTACLGTSIQHPQRTWTWLETWSPIADTWNVAWQAVDKGCRKTHGMPAPRLAHSVYDEWGWLVGKHVVPPAQAPQCTEQHWGNTTVGWVPITTCVNITHVTTPKVW
ncbi:hypothetical protein AAY473_025185 [Plecturocebus cupreus]